VDEIAEPGPGTLALLSVYRRLMPGRKLVGHIVTLAYPESVLTERKYMGLPVPSEVGKVTGATWDCTCGGSSRAMWSRERWARRALINHWNRMHSDRAVERRGAN
jgi:hypothetical protein